MDPNRLNDLFLLTVLNSFYLAYIYNESLAEWVVEVVLES